MKLLTSSRYYQNHLRGRRWVHFCGRVYYEFNNFGAMRLVLGFALLPWRAFHTPKADAGAACDRSHPFAIQKLVLYSHLDYSELRPHELTMDITSPWVERYRSTVVMGGSEMVVLDDGLVVIDSNYMPNEDLAPLEMHRRLRYSNDFSRLRLRVPVTSELDSGISLLSPHSPNYMHFVTEVLPKAVLADDLPPSLPWIVDADVPEGLLDFLTRVVHSRRQIVKVPAMQGARIGEVYVPYADCRVQFDPRGGGIVAKSPRTHFNPELIGHVRSKARSKSIGSDRLKVFFLRDHGTSSGRKLLNQDTLADLLRRNGFVVVDPGRMTPQEQIEIASRTTVVVGSMGAALTNIVWAYPGTKVIAIAGYLPGANYGLFASLAAVLGQNYHLVLGELRDSGHTSILNHDIWVDLDAVQQALNA